MIETVDLADPKGRAASTRFDEHRETQRTNRFTDRLRVVSPSFGRDEHVREHRQARSGEDNLHVVLVHAYGAGEHSCADVPHASEFEQTLNGAVLAPRTVEKWQHNINVSQHAWWLVRLGDREVGAGLRLHQGHRPALRNRWQVPLVTDPELV